MREKIAQKIVLGLAILGFVVICMALWFFVMVVIVGRAMGL